MFLKNLLTYALNPLDVSPFVSGYTGINLPVYFKFVDIVLVLLIVALMATMFPIVADYRYEQLLLNKIVSMEDKVLEMGKQIEKIETEKQEWQDIDIKMEKIAEIHAKRIATETAYQIMLDELGVSIQKDFGNYSVKYVVIKDLVQMISIKVKDKNVKSFCLNFEGTKIPIEELKDGELPYACRDGSFIYQYWLRDEEITSLSQLEEVFKQY